MTNESPNPRTPKPFRGSDALSFAIRVSEFLRHSSFGICHSTTSPRSVGHCSSRRWNHPSLARVVEQAAGIHDRPHVAQRLERINFSGGFQCDRSEEHTYELQ